MWCFSRTSNENSNIYHVLLKRPQTVKMKLTGIFERQNVIRPKWFGFDNVVEYKLDNLIQP